jgi:hypothetical protein
MQKETNSEKKNERQRGKKTERPTDRMQREIKEKRKANMKDHL